MNPAQTSVLRKAALGLATLLVLLECGWGIAGAALGLASVESPAFLSFVGVPKNVVFVVIFIGVLVACCQSIAVLCRSAVLSFIIGIAFSFPGGFGLACGGLALVMGGTGFGFHHEPDLHWFYDGLIACSIAGTWLFTGVVMLLHGSRLWIERGASLESSPVPDRGGGWRPL